MMLLPVIRVATLALAFTVCGTTTIDDLDNEDYRAFLAIIPTGETVPPPSALERGETIVLRLAEDGLFHIEGRANDRPMRFTIDTGASIIVLNGRDARALGLDARNGVPSRIRTASGAAAMRLHRLERLSVAGLELYDVEVAVVENGGPQASLLGLNILGAFGKVSISGQELEITP